MELGGGHGSELRYHDNHLRHVHADLINTIDWNSTVRDSISHDIPLVWDIRCVVVVRVSEYAAYFETTGLRHKRGADAAA